jgi:hypothetical protein
MATVTTRYRCPVTPDECPSSDRRGFCTVHRWERLVPERVYVTAEPDGAPREDAPDGSGPPPGTGANGDADVRPEAPAARPGGRTARPADRPHLREPREGTTAPPTRLQSPPPAAPCLALVLAGALVLVRAEGQEPTRLGRDAADCAHVTDLAALDQLSRLHAELTWRAGRLYVTDLGSVNGTYVDEQPVTGPVQLWPGGHRLRLAEDVDVPLVELDEFGAPR